MNELPASARRFAAALEGLGHDEAVVVLDDSARTAAEAAAALGCQVAEIAKSVVFRRLDDDASVVVVTSGDRRVDPHKVGELVGAVGRADADFVRSTTGYVIGGVPPVAHDGPTVVLVDRSLSRFERVWAAAGHPHAVFPLSPEALATWHGTVAVDTSAD